MCTLQDFPTLRSFGTKSPPPMSWAWNEVHLNPIDHLERGARRGRTMSRSGNHLTGTLVSAPQAAAEAGVPVDLLPSPQHGTEMMAKKSQEVYKGWTGRKPMEKKTPEGLCSALQLCQDSWKRLRKKGGPEYFCAFLLVVFIHPVLDINLRLIDQKAADPWYVNMILISSRQVTHWFSAHCLLELWSSLFLRRT